MSRSVILPILLSLGAAACTPARYALPGELSTVPPLRVSGRQGIQVGQRISFGPYATGQVSRSATRATELRDRLDSHGADAGERYTFSLSRAGTKVAEVQCTAEGSGASTLGVTWEMKRALRCDVVGADGERHAVMLGSSRDGPLSGTVTGADVLQVAGSNRVGAARVPGTAGYTLTRDGTPVAAVDVTNDGAVYLAGSGSDLVAAVAVALLLYQDPLQAAERFREP